MGLMETLFIYGESVYLMMLQPGDAVGVFCALWVRLPLGGINEYVY
jgi:hypothetical protein